MHVTSLTSRFGIGDLGPGALRFVNFLAEAGQTLWQVLPLSPTDGATGHSPYTSVSTFAGNPLVISPEGLAQMGLADAPSLADPPEFPGDVDYQAVSEWKTQLYREAFSRFQADRQRFRLEYDRFLEEHRHWLADFALFMALKSRYHGVSWDRWPEPLRRREPGALREAGRELDAETDWHRFLQFLFFLQWRNLRSYCAERGILVVGDLPYYVSYDSADVWASPELFKLDQEGRPQYVAGVPPDYFSATGQLWGNPVYRWEAMQERGFAWWQRRVGHNLRLYDWVRIDHFRGLVAYWEVPAGEETAQNGTWIEVPVRPLLDSLRAAFPELPILAEDLGLITEDVKQVMADYGLPGMRVLLFAFGDDPGVNPYAPHNLVRNCVAYTGTHDNNTCRGWFGAEAGEEERARVLDYLGRKAAAEEIAGELTRLVLMSVADWAIVPMQDHLGLGAEARMNRPAAGEGNWRWRLADDRYRQELAPRLAAMSRIYGRC